MLRESVMLTCTPGVFFVIMNPSTFASTRAAAAGECDWSSPPLCLRNQLELSCGSGWLSALPPHPLAPPFVAACRCRKSRYCPSLPCFAGLFCSSDCSSRRVFGDALFTVWELRRWNQFTEMTCSKRLFGQDSWV
jgi:hypothetical protein